MVFGWSKTKYSPIGIDFGMDSIKLLQVTATDPPQVVAAGVANVPEAARTDLNARHQFLVTALRLLLSQQRFHDRRAICSIPAFQTIVQNFQVPSIESDAIDDHVALQLRQRLNIDPSGLVIRLVNVPLAAANKSEVICMAASRETVLRYIDIARAVKLEVVGMHSEPMALMPAFAHMFRKSGSDTLTTCFIDIGAATSKVVIAHGQQIVFAKAIQTAGDHMTRALAQSKGISFVDARQERMQLASGLDQAAARNAARVHGHDETQDATATATIHEHDQLNPPDEQDPNPPDEPLSDTLDCLIDELLLCQRYHRGLFPGREIDRLIFLGGESRHTAMCQRIARAMRTGAQLGDPLARTIRSHMNRPAHGVDLNKAQPGWAVPLGLCLSEANL